MKYSLFLGCTIPVRAQNYELSARKIAEVLGMEFVDLEDFSCCGYPVKSTDSFASMLLAAKNLAVAAVEGSEICTLCNACTGTMLEVNKELNEDEKLREKVNRELDKIGLEFKPGVRVRHFSRILHEDIGLDTIREKVTKELTGFRFSAHYGCHYLRPRHIHEGFDDPENPVSMEQLIEATGATAVDYRTKLDCCGGAILGVEEDIALRMSKKKLDELKEKGIDALVTGCPFCTIMYDDNQRKIESTFETEYNLPVLYLPQLLGLAFGMDKKELGFRLNKVKAKALLQKLEGEE